MACVCVFGKIDVVTVVIVDLHVVCTWSILLLDSYSFKMLLIE